MALSLIAYVELVPPLPASRRAINRLGERLAADTYTAGDGPQYAEDRALFADVVLAHGEALAKTADQLAAMGYATTTRLKTTGTLMDKVRRGMGLGEIQDIAGARIVGDWTRLGQTEVGNFVAQDFAERFGGQSDLIDRRADPRSGYRALHVVVRVDALSVEIQLRTPMQDAWAQTTERLGDVWGRGIRYGEPPPDADRRLFDGDDTTRGDLWDIMLEVSDLIARLEATEQALDMRNRNRIGEQLRSELGVSVSKETEIIHNMLAQIRAITERLV